MCNSVRLGASYNARISPSPRLRASPAVVKVVSTSIDQNGGRGDCIVQTTQYDKMNAKGVLYFLQSDSGWLYRVGAEGSEGGRVGHLVTQTVFEKVDYDVP